jgi:putative Mn2+ efflux pump MntP
MRDVGEFVVRSLAIGGGATVVMDVWGAALRRFGVPTLKLELLGRWVGHFADGQVMHDSIAKAPPVRGELVLGWLAHYGIGVTFAALLLGVAGLDWARAPSLLPALAIGLVTVVAPLFVLQPAFGAGIASSRTPTPLFNAGKSVVTHAVYGLGLYLAALATAPLFRR